jgi:hypothetical protein
MLSSTNDRLVLPLYVLDRRSSSAEPPLVPEQTSQQRAPRYVLRSETDRLDGQDAAARLAIGVRLNWRLIRRAWGDRDAFPDLAGGAVD